MSRTDDGLHRHCQHRSARLQRQRHVGVHSRDQRFVRIFEHQTDASRSSPGIDFGAEQIDPAAPLPARQSRHNSLGLHPFLDQGRQMGRHIREYPDPVQAGERHHHAARRDELPRPSIECGHDPIR